MKLIATLFLAPLWTCAAFPTSLYAHVGEKYVNGPRYDTLFDKLPLWSRQLVETAQAVTRVETVPTHYRKGEPRYRWREPKHVALLALADQPDERSIQVLLANLAYCNPRSTKQESIEGLGCWFPCADALVRIGRPAMGPVLERVKQTDKNGRTLHNLCWVLNEYYGRNIARQLLREELANTGDDRLRRNLSGALEPYFSTREPGIPPFGIDYKD